MIPHRRDNIAPTAKQMDIKTPLKMSCYASTVLRIYSLWYMGHSHSYIHLDCSIETNVQASKL